jgi:hypothetical protein
LFGNSKAIPVTELEGKTWLDHRVQCSVSLVAAAKAQPVDPFSCKTFGIPHS